MTSRRARSDAAKAARRQDIIDAAVSCLAERGADAVSMQDIATSCELTKPALYTYFPTREELLFAVYRHLLNGWMNVFNRSLMAASSPLPREEFNRIFVTSFAASPLLGHLTNHLFATIAPGLGGTTLEELRTDTADQMAGLRSLLTHYEFADARTGDAGTGDAGTGDAGTDDDLAWAYYTILAGAAQSADFSQAASREADAPQAITERAAFTRNCLATLNCLR